MSSNFSDEYQYNSCTSRGICSINPKTYSMQEILVLYLANSAYYILELQKLGYENAGLRSLILNTISIMVSNPEFSEKDFRFSIDTFKKEYPKLCEKYKTACEEKNITPNMLKTNLEYKGETDIINSIRKGEETNRIRSKELSEELMSLYRILFIVLKSMCVNVQTLESFGENISQGYNEILKILNFLNKKQDEKNVTELLINASKTDNCLMLDILEVLQKNYGSPKPVCVSYSTVPGKAIMVVGSNLKEIESILEATKTETIDVYTHDEMILAHTYPKFQKYKNLKGQFGQGYENCLLDFSTFPGPIILTKHSLFNVEHLYRGRLFTTDSAYSKGVIPIKNNDYSEVINSAYKSKGFKNGKKCESEEIGFDIELLKNNITQKINSKEFSHLFIVEPWEKESENYILNLIEKLPENVLLISLKKIQEKDNILSVNGCFNSKAVLQILEEINPVNIRKNIKLVIFMPKCDRFTVSKLIYLSSYLKVNIYLGKCNPLILNTSMIKKMEKSFQLKTFSSVKQDLNDIMKD